MRHRVLRFVLLAAALALPCAIQADGVQRLSYAQYGFDIGIPAGTSKCPVPVPHDSANGVVDAYVSGGCGIVIGVLKHPKLSGQAAIGEMVAGARKQFGGSTVAYRSGQGVEFQGLCATPILDAQMIKSFPTLQGTAKPGDSFRLTLYSATLPGSPDRAVVLVAVGPASLSSQVDQLGQWLAGSVNFTGLKPAQTTSAQSFTPAPEGASAPPPQQMALSSGEIALYGKVESIKADGRGLTMLADMVIPYGQNQTALDPPRSKIVTCDQLPKEVVVGSRVVIIGRNAGTGKPMPARLVALDSRAARE